MSVKQRASTVLRIPQAFFAILAVLAFISAMLSFGTDAFLGWAVIGWILMIPVIGVIGLRWVLNG